jgi:hypothetical protein
LLEKLLKECVLASDPTVARHDQGQGDDLFGSVPCEYPSFPGARELTFVPASPAFESQSASIVLLLAHPHALKNLHTALSHVTSFRSKIGSLSPSEENSQMAKSILVDLIDCSGVDLNALEPVLSDLLAETKRFSGKDQIILAFPFFQFFDSGGDPTESSAMSAHQPDAVTSKERH